MRVVLLTLVFFGSLIGSAAAAVTLEEGLDAVGSTVGELPKVAPPSVPELPVTSPPPPVASPDVDRVVSEPPAVAPPSKSAAPAENSEDKAPGPVAGSVDRVVGTVETVAGTAPRTLPRAAAPLPPVAGASPDPVSRPEARVSSDSAARPSGPEPRSVRPAVAAPLRELLAYVWPAVALSPIGSALIAQLVELERGSPFLGAGAPSSLFSISGSALAGSPTSSAAPSAPNAAPPSAAPFFSPHGGGMSLLVALIMVLASLVGLVALARLTVGEDFFSMRWLR